MCNTESVSIHSILDVQYLISPDQQDEVQRVESATPGYNHSRARMR